MGDTSPPLSHALACLKHQSHHGLDYCSMNSQKKLLQQAINEYENFCSKTQNQVSLWSFLPADIEEETVKRGAGAWINSHTGLQAKLVSLGAFSCKPLVHLVHQKPETNQAGLLLSSTPWQGLKASDLNTSGTAPGQLQLSNPSLVWNN